jgi:hypothetical protein
MRDCLAVPDSSGGIARAVCCAVVPTVARSLYSILHLSMQAYRKRNGRVLCVCLVTSSIASRMYHGVLQSL